MRKLIFLIIIFITLGLVLPNSVFGIGQMTKPIVIKDVLRGQGVQEVLILFNSEDKEMIFQLKADGDIADWASFYKIDDKNLENPITEISIPPQSKIEAIVKFTIPKDTPNGEYSGEVAIISAPIKEEGAGKMIVGVGERIGRYVSITVTDKEIIKFETTIIPLKYGVGKGEPLKIKVIYDNQGNVAIKPDIQLKITQVNTGNTVHNAIYPYPEGENAIKPFERKEFPNLIEWQTAGQENGKYKAEIKVLFGGKTYKEESFRFDIGVDIMALLLAGIAFLGIGNLTFGWLVVGLFFVILLGILGLFYKNPKLLKVWIKRIKSIF